MLSPNGPWAFDPWNLDQNVRLSGVRTLVVAESHYVENGFSKEDCNHKETDRLARDHGLEMASSSASSPLFRTVAETFATDTIVGGDVWKHIYYYNYFQRPMDHSDEKPLRQDYANGVSAFDAVLDRLNPNAVVIMSSRLWHGMENAAERIGKFEFGTVYAFLGASRALHVPAIHTWHPSSRGRHRYIVIVSDRRPRVQSFLAVVRDGCFGGTA